MAAAADDERDPRFELDYTCTAQTDAARLRTLVGEGPLRVPATHFFVETLVLSPPFTEITQLLVDWLAMLVLLPHSSLTGSAHFSIRLSRISTLLRALVETGNLKSCAREGDSWRARLAVLVADIVAAAASLPMAARQLAAADCIPFPNSPITNSWFDFAEISSFAAPGHLRALAQFRSILGAGIYAEAHGIQGAPPVPANLSRIISQAPFTIGEATRDMQGTPAQIQAVLIPTFFVNRLDPDYLTFFPTSGSGIAELFRLAAGSAAQRYEPLFKVGFRNAYPAISAVLTPLFTGDQAAALVASHAQQLGFSCADGLTAPVVDSMEAAWRRVLHSVNNDGSPEGASLGPVQRADLATTLALQARTASSSSAERSDDSVDQWNAADSMDCNKELYAELTPLLSAPIDLVAAAALMLKHKAALGRIVLGDIKRKVPPKNVLSKFLPCRAASVVNHALNKAMAVDAKGEAQPTWVRILSEGTTAKLVAGKISTSQIHYWRDVVRPYLVYSRGKHAVSMLEAGMDTRSEALFLNPVVMAEAETPLRLLFSALGHSGKHAGSAESVTFSICERAKSINFLARSPGTTKLRDSLLSATVLIFKVAAEGDQLMLQSPVNVAVRPKGLLQHDEGISAIFKEMDESLQHAQTEQRNAIFGGRAASGSYTAVASQSWTHAPQRSQSVPASPASRPRGEVFTDGKCTWAFKHGGDSRSNGGRGSFTVAVYSEEDAKKTKGCAANAYPHGNKDPWCNMGCAHHFSIGTPLSVSHNAEFDSSWHKVTERSQSSQHSGKGKGKGKGSSSNGQRSSGKGKGGRASTPSRGGISKARGKGRGGQGFRRQP